MTSEQISSFEPELRALLTEFEPCFAQDRTREHWLKYMAGLMADIPRKSVEPIALAAGVPVRTLQEFLSQHRWDHQRADDTLQRLAAAACGSAGGIGILDASAHPKQGDKTPGVQRQWCGQTGKVDVCVIGQHLLYTDNHWSNPFSCMLASDLYLPRSWAEDRERCRAAGIPDEVLFRTKWRIGVDQVARAIGNGVRLNWVVGDEDYGRAPGFWLEMDRLGQQTIAEVPKDLMCWATPPACQSLRPEHAAHEVCNLARYSPTFTDQGWRKMAVKTTTRGKMMLKVKLARVQLVAEAHDHRYAASVPTDRRYWLIVTDNLATGERKYWVSNAGPDAKLEEMLQVGFSRWHVEKWFERAKQQAGFGSFEVRTYTGLIRHWLSSRVAMLFLARQTRRLREKKSGDHAGAGGPGGQRDRLEDLEAMAECLGRNYPGVCVSPAA